MIFDALLKMLMVCSRIRCSCLRWCLVYSGLPPQHFRLLAPSRPVDHYRFFNGHVRWHELVGEHYQVLAVPSGAGNQQAIEPQEIVSVANRLGALISKCAVAISATAERLDRRSVH